MYDKQGVTIIGVPGSQTRNGNNKWDVQLNDGTKSSTFDPGMANKAYQLVNQPGVTVRIEQKPNPRGGAPFENFVDVFPAGQAPPQVQGMQQGPPQGGPPVQQAQQGPPVQQGGGGGNFPPEVATRLVKISASEIAFDAVFRALTGAGPEAIDDGIERAEALARRIYLNVRSHEQLTTPAGTQATTPAEVAQAVNAEAGAQVVQQGAAPTPQEPAQTDIQWT